MFGFPIAAFTIPAMGEGAGAVGGIVHLSRPAPHGWLSVATHGEYTRVLHLFKSVSYKGGMTCLHRRFLVTR